MFSTITQSLTSAAQSLHSHVGGFKESMSSGINNMYSYLQQLFTRKKSDNQPAIPTHPLATAQFNQELLSKKDLPLSLQGERISEIVTPPSEAKNNLSSIAQQGIFPTYGRAYFRTKPPVPADERAKLLHSSRYKDVFSKFTGSDMIKQRRVEVFEKLNTRYLLKYPLNYPLAATDQSNRGRLKMTQADKDLSLLQRHLEQKISALIEEFQELIHKVEEGRATPQELNTFTLFIDQQNHLLDQFESELAAKSTRWES